jgi:hypothetical protein
VVSIKPPNQYVTISRTTRITFEEKPIVMTVDSQEEELLIGGLQSVVLALKEMIVYPLQFPEAFAKLGVEPPKGSLQSFSFSFFNQTNRNSVVWSPRMWKNTCGESCYK